MCFTIDPSMLFGLVLLCEALTRSSRLTIFSTPDAAACYITGLSQVLLSSGRFQYAHMYSLSSNHASMSTLQCLPGATHPARPRTCAVGTEPRGGFLRPSDCRRRWLRNGRLFSIACSMSRFHGTIPRINGMVCHHSVMSLWILVHCPMSVKQI